MKGIRTKKKSIRTKKKIKVKKLPTIKRLRNKLDKVFNTYIKLRDGKCILSGVTEELQCSHYYDKRNSPFLRWDERNAHAMAKSIHFRHHHGKAPDYSLWMVKKYDIVFLEKLSIDSYKKYDPKREDYNRLINHYIEKINVLKLKNN